MATPVQEITRILDMANIETELRNLKAKQKAQKDAQSQQR